MSAEETSKEELLLKLQEKNKQAQERCIAKIKAVLAEENCDIEITCVINGRGTQLHWGVRSK